MNEEKSLNILKNVFGNKLTICGSKKDHIELDCPFCGKEKHLYLNFKKCFNKKSNYFVSSWDCKKCSESGSIYKLFKQIDHLDILKDFNQIGKTFGQELKPEIFIKQEEHKEEELENIVFPPGYKRIGFSSYIEEDRFLKNFNYHINEVGVSDLQGFKNRLIFPVYEKGNLKAYLSRTVLSNEKLKKINSTREKQYHIKRWKNSQTDFSKLFFGIDELNDKIESVVLVEGLFDKFSIDNKLNFQKKDSKIKVLSCFGKKITNKKIEKLLKYNIKNLYLFFDPDAVSEIKKFSYILELYFNVRILYHPTKDPGDLNKEELKNIFNSSKSILEFYRNKLIIKDLK